MPLGARVRRAPVGTAVAHGPLGGAEEASVRHGDRHDAAGASVRQDELPFRRHIQGDPPFALPSLLPRVGM